MKTPTSKPLYKGISLCLKVLIITASCVYIYTKVFHRADHVEMEASIKNAFSGQRLFCLIAACLLMPINWALEAIKWRILVDTLAPITFFESLKGVLSGVAVSTVTPNRAGEFAGRIFYLQEADKMRAAFLSFAGSACQLFCTMLFAAISFFLLRATHLGEFIVTGNPGIYAVAVLAVFACLLAIGCFFLFPFLVKGYGASAQKWKRALNAVNDVGKKKMLVLFFLSVLRYLVFFLQFSFLLRFFSNELSAQDMILLIPLVFFSIALIPTFALTEIGVRGAAAIVIFQSVTEDLSAVVAASFLLWIINIALPALAGCFFVLKLKFFTKE